MSNAERDRLRKLQDKWLALKSIQYQISQYGWDHSIAHLDSPSFEVVRDLLLPDWEGFFNDFLREANS